MIRRARCTLGLILGMGWIATTATAATLSLAWNGTAGDTAHRDVRTTAEVEVWVELIAGETLSAVYFACEATPQLGQVQATSNQAGWSIGGAGHGAELGDGLQQWAIHTPNTNVLAGPGSFQLGTLTVFAAYGHVNDNLPVAFDHARTSLLDGAGADYSWDARFHTSIAGFAAYGPYGNPGWEGGVPGVGQPVPNPLLVRLTTPSGADFNDDGDVDFDDFASLASALSGPGAAPVGDPSADADEDGDADLDDYAWLQRTLSQPRFVTVIDPCVVCPAADVNLDGVVDEDDAVEIRSLSNWFAAAGAAGTPRADVDANGFVDGGDTALVRSAACWLSVMPCSE